jgi:hypothetical protein
MKMGNLWQVGVRLVKRLMFTGDVIVVTGSPVSIVGRKGLESWPRSIYQF